MQLKHKDGGLGVHVADNGAWALEYHDISLLSACDVVVELDGASETVVPVHRANEEVSGNDVLGDYDGVVSRFRVRDNAELIREIRLYHNRACAAVFVSIVNSAPGEPIRVSEVRPVRGKLDVEPGNVQALVNDWERCFGEDNVIGLDGGEAVRSAWNADFYDKRQGRALAVGMLSATEMFTWLEADAVEGRGVCFSAVGDTRSGEQGVELPPGGSLVCDGILLVASDDPNKAIEDYALAVRDFNDVRFMRKPVVGWLDWYCYYGDISEESVLANLDAIDRHLRGYGVDYIQVDDGWQQVRSFTHYDVLDLTCTTCSGAPWEPNEHFKSGMKHLADRIHEKGYKAGIWVRPFCINSEAEEYQRGEPWVLKNPSDHPHPDRASVDVSSDSALVWLGGLFKKLAHDWGYDYIKYDFVTMDVLPKEAHNPPKGPLPPLRIRDPKTTSARALHNAFKALRDGAGEGVFLLGCNSLEGSGLGLVDGHRISGDVFWGRWSLTRDMLRSSAYRYYQDGVFWQNDPDVLMVRDKIPLHQAQFWATYVGLTGSMVFLGDSIPDLSDERLDVLKKVLPVYPGKAKPLRLFDEKYPSVWHLPVEKSFGRWDVVGLYNWDEGENTVGFDFAELGLEGDQTCHLFDFWAGVYLGEHKKRFESRLDGIHCKAVSVRPKKGWPQVVGTQYHIAQGGNELLDECWNEEKGELIIKTRGVPGSVFKLFAIASDSFSHNETKSDCDARTVMHDNSVIEVTFTVGETGENEIRLAFTR